MSSSDAQEDWDFSPVIGLIHSLSITANENAPNKQAETKGPSQYIYKNSVTPALSEIRQESDSQLGNFDKIWEYLGHPLGVLPPEPASNRKDVHFGIPRVNTGDEQTGIKGVRWRDEFDGDDLADNDEVEDPPRLTKTQRKKERRKERRKALTRISKDGKTPSSSSEDDSESEKNSTRTPDSKGVINQILYGAPPSDGSKPNGLSLLKRHQVSTGSGASLAAKSLAANGNSRVSNLYEEGIKLAAAAAKKTKLMAILHEKFIDERQYLTNVNVIPHTNDAISNITPEGIHVFVDASNIMIGFHDALKLSRSLPLTHRLRRQPISFHSLSLILTRGRPTAKCVVVGSDNFPAMQEARAIGYETNILDRVHKAKELTSRQRKYISNGGGYGTQSAGSGSETGNAAAAVQYAPEKWVEQAVDEILHLKMMESIVDAAKPSTMVLATGDAAEAEYSGGFLKMVERALNKGWKIELASFRHNISGSYRRKEFRQKWGNRFKIVELDDFVEVMLGVE